MRIRSRSPGNWKRRSRGPRSSAMPMCTRPTGFSGVPPPGPAIPVTPTPSVAPVRLADSVGERQRHFGAYRAFGFDQLCGNIDQRGFQLVAVADHAAEKIDGASGNVGEPFGEQAARAAFRDGNRGAIFGEHARDDFFHRFAVGGIEMLAERERHAVHHFVENLIRLWRDRATRRADGAEFPVATRGSWFRCRDTARRAAKRAARLPIPEGR